MAKLRCPCTHQLVVPKEDIDKRITCPKCNRVLRITAPRPSQASDVSRHSNMSAPETAPPCEQTPSSPSFPSLSDADQATETYAGRKDKDAIEVAKLLAPPQAPDELGRLAQYRILRILGKGGMGLVLLAEDTRLQRQAAVKIMLPAFAEDPLARQRFLREARAAAAISHDNVVTIFQVDEDRGLPFIALQYLKGTPLDRYLHENDRLPIARVIRIGREMAEGLQAAHALGLVHRDIKPGNVWLEAPNGRVKILDFGLARAQVNDNHLTHSGAVVGTPAYMSPEQAAGKDLDARSDLFSLGVVLYRLTTGRDPFKGDSIFALLMAIGSETQTPVRELNPKVPEGLEQLIDALMAKNRDDRPASAQEVIERLDGLAVSKAASMSPQPNTAAKTRNGLRHEAPAQRKSAVIARPPEPLTVDASGKSGQRRRSAGTAGSSKGMGGTWIIIGIAAAATIFVALLVVGIVYFAKGKPAPEGQANAENGLKNQPPPPAEPNKPAEIQPCLWELASKQKILRGHTDAVSCVAMTAGGRRIVSGSADKTVKVWDAEKGEEIFTLTGHTDVVKCVTYSADGRRIFSGGFDGLKIWDAENRKELQSVNILDDGKPDIVNRVALSRDGRQILVGTGHGSIRVLNAENGDEVLRLKARGYISSLVVSPDGRRIVSCGNNGTIRVWNAEDGGEIQSLTARSVGCVALSPDCRRVVGGGVAMLALWNLETGKELFTLDGHQKVVLCVAVSPDGRRIISGGIEGDLNVWNAETGEQMTTKHGHKDGVLDLAVSTDGQRFVTCSPDKTIIIWEADKARKSAP